MCATRCRATSECAQLAERVQDVICEGWPGTEHSQPDLSPSRADAGVQMLGSATASCARESYWASVGLCQPSTAVCG